MKNNVNTKNTIIVVLCITIILLCIGFSYLAMKVDLKEKNEVKFNVDFYKVEELTPVQGGKNKPTVLSSITNSKKTINMQFSLYSPRDEISFKVVIKNTGDMPAQIINLIETPDYINNESAAKNIYPVKISHNDIVGEVLQPDEETVLTIMAYFNYKEQAKKIVIPYQISILAASS